MVRSFLAATPTDHRDPHVFTLYLRHALRQCVSTCMGPWGNDSILENPIDAGGKGLGQAIRHVSTVSGLITAVCAELHEMYICTVNLQDWLPSYFFVCRGSIQSVCCIMPTPLRILRMWTSSKVEEFVPGASRTKYTCAQLSAATTTWASKQFGNARLLTWRVSTCSHIVWICTSVKKVKFAAFNDHVPGAG